MRMFHTEKIFDLNQSLVRGIYRRQVHLGYNKYRQLVNLYVDISQAD